MKSSTPFTFLDFSCGKLRGSKLSKAFDDLFPFVNSFAPTRIEETIEMCHWVSFLSYLNPVIGHRK